MPTESFGIWNLLKTLLTTSESGNNSASSMNPTSTDKSAEQSSNPSSESIEKPEKDSPTKINACEEYLLRHEMLTRKHKK